MSIKIKPFRYNWGREAHLGPFVSWNEIDQVEVGLNLTVLIIGLRFTWGDLVIDPSQVDKRPRWALGTRFQNDFGPWRYACAGEDIIIGTAVEADLAGRIVSPEQLPDSADIQEIIYGNIRRCTDVALFQERLLGWPEVTVKKGRYCWIKEPEAN